MNLFNRLFGKKEKPTPSDIEMEGFAELMMDALRKFGISDIEFDEEQYCLKLDEGRVMFLGNSYADFLNLDPEADLDEFFANNIHATFTEIPKTFDAEVKGKLFPVVRERVFSEFNSLRIHIDKPPEEALNPLPFQPLADNIVAHVAYDTDFSIGYIHETTLQQWGITFEQAMEFATGNLLANSHESYKEFTPGVFVSP